MVTLVIVTLIILITAYVLLSHKYQFRTKDGLEKKVGDLQFELIDKYAEGEAYLFYLDQSAKYSLDLSLYNLAENGGHYVELAENGIYSLNDCGDYNGYQLWATPEKECYPDYEENFGYYFSSYFSEYMNQFDIEDPYFDFDVSYDEEGVLNILGLKNVKTVPVYREGQKEKEETKEEPITEAEIPEGLMWPVKGHTVISSCYGWRTLNGRKDCHDGIDIPASTGTLVYAIEDGEVIDERTAPGNGLGNSIAIRHNDNFLSAYSHLNTKRVSKGDKVKKGQIIGTVGNTGSSYGAHLDLKLYSNRNLVYKKDRADINPICVFSEFSINPSTSGYNYAEGCTCGAKCT